MGREKMLVCNGDGMDVRFWVLEKKGETTWLLGNETGDRRSAAGRWRTPAR